MYILFLHLVCLFVSLFLSLSVSLKFDFPFFFLFRLSFLLSISPLCFTPYTLPFARRSLSLTILFIPPLLSALILLLLLLFSWVSRDCINNPIQPNPTQYRKRKKKKKHPKINKKNIQAKGKKMSSNSGASSRVSIPSTARRLIQNIKEITGNHSDEDVYAMLLDCNMDPNEATQRLLFQDTFHEVKGRREKRKENVKIRGFEEPRRKPANQGRGTKGGRGGFSSQYPSHDAGVGRTTAARSENGSEENQEKGPRSSSQPNFKEVDLKKLPSVLKEPLVTGNGSMKVPSDGLTDGQLLQVSSAGAIEGESKSRQILAEVADFVAAEGNLGNLHENGIQSQEIQDASSGKVENAEFIFEPIISEKNYQLPAEPVPESSLGLGSSLLHTIGPSKGASSLHYVSVEEEPASKLELLKFSDVQHVIIPSHIQVPDAIKSVLSFGSLDISCGVLVAEMNSCKNNLNSDHTSEPMEDADAKDETLCEEDAPSTAQEDESSPEPPQASSLVPETTEGKVAAPKEDNLKQDMMSAVGAPCPVVQTAPNYNFGFMPPMFGNPVIPIEGLEHQARLSNSVGGTSLPMPSPTPTPPPTQSVGPIPNSVVVSAQAFPMFRQAYPPNYIPYNHYFSPIYVPPTLHQFFGPGGFAPQLQAGNVYLPPPLPSSAAQVGMKIASSHFKASVPPTNTPNQVPPPVGLSSPGYGVYGPSQVGYGLSGPVTTGSSNTNEDFVASAMKESNMYLGHQTEEGSAVWVPAPGRDSTNIPITSFFNLPPPQGQHITTIAPPQPSLAAFPTIYHPLQAIAAASPTSAGAHTMIHQQSQSLAGHPPPQVETVVSPSPQPPPSNGYQQTQQSQRQQPINCNGSFQY